MADYIDRQELRNRLSESLDEARKVPSQARWKTGLLRAMFLLQLEPSVDAVEVVRCKDCKHYKYGHCYQFSFSGKYEDMVISVSEDDYCKWGEKE